MPAGFGILGEPDPCAKEQVVEVEKLLRSLVVEIAPGGGVDCRMVKLDAVPDVVMPQKPEGLKRFTVPVRNFEERRAKARLLGETVVVLIELCGAACDIAGGVRGQGNGGRSVGEALDEQSLDHVVHVVFVENRGDFGDDAVFKEKA